MNTRKVCSPTPEEGPHVEAMLLNNGHINTKY